MANSKRCVLAALLAASLTTCLSGCSATGPEETVMESDTTPKAQTKAHEPEIVFASYALEAHADFDTFYDWADDVAIGTLIEISEPFVIDPAREDLTGLETYAVEYTFTLDKTVKGAMAKETKSNPNVYTAASISGKKSSTALASDIFKVRVPGGETEHIKCDSPTPTLELGQQYMLFLEESWMPCWINMDTGDGSYYLLSPRRAVWKKESEGVFASGWFEEKAYLDELMRRSRNFIAQDYLTEQRQLAKEQLDNGEISQYDYDTRTELMQGAEPLAHIFSKEEIKEWEDCWYQEALRDQAEYEAQQQALAEQEEQE